MESFNEERYLRLERFLNNTAKSGVVKIEVVIEEMARLVGLDPKTCMYLGKR